MVIVSTNRLIRFTGVTPGKQSVNLQALITAPDQLDRYMKNIPDIKGDIR